MLSQQALALQGEALSSISDISLLEIVTKTHRSPNEYHKVLNVKAAKCLYLGIDDCRGDVGTTIINSRFASEGPIHKLLNNLLIEKALASVLAHLFWENNAKLCFYFLLVAKAN
ncbi:hypothetical protein H5410_009360, partial [Solanum commersonii]